MITRRVCRHRAGCFAVATHGVTEGSTAGVPAFCPAHSEESMVDFRFNSSTKTCVHPGCADRPAYRAPGRRAQYCHLHAEPGMTMKCKRRGNVGFKQADEGQNSAPDPATVQMCTRAGCGKRATFGSASSKRRELCTTHGRDSPGMVHVAPTPCGDPGCVKGATHGVHGSGKREFCLSHAPEGTVRLGGKQCHHRRCRKRRSNAPPGSTEALYCNDHAPEGFVDLVSCLIPACRRARTYGWEHTGRKEFCAEHAADGMASLTVGPGCRHPGCGKKKEYGFAGRRREYCAAHAKEGMRSRKGWTPNEWKTSIESYRKMREARRRQNNTSGCLEPDCTERASDGSPSSGKRGYCAAHAREEVCAPRTERCRHRGCSAGARGRCPGHASAAELEEEARSPVGGDSAGCGPGSAPDATLDALEAEGCGHPGCTRRSSHGSAGSQLPEFCAPHAAKGMVHLRHRSMCTHTGCTRRPLPAVPGSAKAEVCAVHAKVTVRRVNIRFAAGELARIDGSRPKSCRYGGGGDGDGGVKEELPIPPEPPSKKIVVEVPDKMCGRPGCTTKSSYGSANSQRPEFCAPHASKGMVDLRHKSKCRHAGCARRPSYAVVGSVKAEICTEHARDVRGLVLVRGKGIPNHSSIGVKGALHAAGRWAKEKENPQACGQLLADEVVAGAAAVTGGAGESVLPAAEPPAMKVAVLEPFMGFAKRRRRAGGFVSSPLTS
ncbi:unnamed protein product [Scytosiphon promiscuus]